MFSTVVGWYNIAFARGWGVLTGVLLVVVFWVWVVDVGFVVCLRGWFTVFSLVW